MNKKKPVAIIDSRHLKIIAAKRELLKDSIVFIILDEEKHGDIDKAALRKIADMVDQHEPSGIYFPTTKKMDIQFYDKSTFKNKDILVTIGHEDEEVDYCEVEQEFMRALPHARSVDFIHKAARIVRDS